MLFKKNKKVRVVSIFKITTPTVIQYHVKVDGFHVEGGNCRTEEEAKMVASKYLGLDELYKCEYIVTYEKSL